MGLRFSRRSLTIAVVLVISGFEAITPDADDLASSLALRILRMQPADPGHSSADDAEETGDLAGCEIVSEAGAHRFVHSLRQVDPCPIGLAPGADLHGRCPAASFRPSPSTLKSSCSGYRLDC